MVRSFISIPCPESVKDRIIEVQKEIVGYGAMTPVGRENMHLTLKFLGDVNEKTLEEVKNTLNAVSDTPKFNATFIGLGVFPNQSYVRVIWVGIGEGSTEMMELAGRIDEKLSAFGFGKDEKFHPHLTIARVKNVTDKGGLRDAIKKYSSTIFSSFSVEGIDLMESRLTPKGPVYSVLNEFKLK